MQKPRCRTGCFTRDVDIFIEGDYGTELKTVKVAIHYFVDSNGNKRKTSLWVYDELTSKYRPIKERTLFDAGQFSTPGMMNFHGYVVYHMNAVARRLHHSPKQVYNSNGPKFRKTGTYPLDYGYR